MISIDKIFNLTLIEVNVKLRDLIALYGCMSKIANFFQMPILSSLTGNKASATYKPQLDYNDDLGKLSLDANYFRKMANTDRDLKALKFKQKSDPNSKSLAGLIQKKEELLKQMQEVQQKRNEITFGRIQGALKMSLLLMDIG